jgi:Tfp pilus assembly protein PilN
MVLGLLVIAVAFVTVYVLTSNTVSNRKAQLASLQQQVTQMQAAVTRLDSYQRFEKLAQARAVTVRQIASERFDWYQALNDLSKVVPANATLQSLVATVSPGSGAAGSGGSIRGDISAPAFELKGCTGSQDEVAQLMSRLRVMGGVQRVTLADSSKAAGGGSGTCGNGPGFDMVVFFQPLSTTATAGVVK